MEIEKKGNIRRRGGGKLTWIVVDATIVGRFIGTFTSSAKSRRGLNVSQRIIYSSRRHEMWEYVGRKGKGKEEEGRGGMRAACGSVGGWRRRVFVYMRTCTRRGPNSSWRNYFLAPVYVEKETLDSDIRFWWWTRGFQPPVAFSIPTHGIGLSPGPTTHIHNK